MRRVLVTGATGFIGSHVVAALAAAGHEVVASGRDRSRLRALAGRSMVTKMADLATDPLQPLVAGCDAVVHCAALSSPWGAPEAFRVANVVATRRLLDAAGEAEAGCFVHFSSPSIYFRLADQFDLDESFTPTGRWANHYARSKWDSEQCVNDARHAGMSRVILRPRAVFGEGDRAIFPRIAAVARRGWFPRIAGGHALVDATYVGNVTDAVTAALELPCRHVPYVFNLTNGEPMPVRELLDVLFERLGYTVRSLPLPRTAAVALGGVSEVLARLHPGHPEPRLSRYGIGVLGYSLTMDISRAREVLDYSPRVSIDEGIGRFCRWWRSHEGY